MCVGVERPSETHANKIWGTKPRESEPRSKFVWVHKAKWWESYWSRRPRGVQRLSETNPLSFWEARLMESKPRLIFFCFQTVEGNEANINFGGLWLGEKNSVIGFREITKELGSGGGGWGKTQDFKRLSLLLKILSYPCLLISKTKKKLSISCWKLCEYWKISKQLCFYFFQTLNKHEVFLCYDE